MVLRIEPEAFWLFRPGLADELVGGKAAQSLEPASVVVGIHEQLQVQPEFVVASVMVALDRGVLDGSVHPLDLTVRPWAARLGQAVLDLRLLARPFERMPAVQARPVLDRPVGGCLRFGLLVQWLVVGKLDAVIREHPVDRVRHGGDQIV